MFESENEIVQQLIAEFNGNIDEGLVNAHARLELESCLCMDDGEIELHSTNMGEIEKYISWLKEQIPEQPAEVIEAEVVEEMVEAQLKPGVEVVEAEIIE